MYAFDIQLQLLGKKRENIVASNFEKNKTRKEKKIRKSESEKKEKMMKKKN